MMVTFVPKCVNMYMQSNHKKTPAGKCHFSSCEKQTKIQFINADKN